MSPDQVKLEKLKRGFKSLLKDPSIFFNEKKQSIKLHFDMNHGHGNLEKAANLLPEKDRKDFIKYVSTKTWLIGHCIFISKNKKMMERFYNDLFTWLPLQSTFSAVLLPPLSFFVPCG